MIPGIDLISRRREMCAQSWGRMNEVIAVASGEAIPIPGGADQRYEFRAHPDFRWLTGISLEGGVVCFDPESGWEEFLPRTTRDARIWEGAADVTRGRPREELAGWIAARKGKKCVWLGAASEGDLEARTRFSSALLHMRRSKDAFEVEAVSNAIRGTSYGFLKIPDLLHPGISERSLQIEIEAEMYRHGIERTAYGTIVGFGDHSAVLHFPPSDRIAARGDVALIDMGGEIGGYVADVTRTFVVGGVWEGEARALYEMLLEVQTGTIEQCRVGVEWHEVHRYAARGIARGLRDLGVLRCAEDEALESEAIALFLPHGVGHMVGLGVRDASGVYPGREEGRKCCGVRVRADLPLGENYLMTVEPGIYFIPALLNDSEARNRFSAQVNFERAEQLQRLGGMRIEDNILVTRDGPRNLTAAISK